jgi:hypothetical protein
LLVAFAACGDRPPSTGADTLDPVEGLSLTEAAPAHESEPVEVPPKAATGEARPISFRDLSLVGANVSGLLDLYFDPKADANGWTFPQSIQALDGEQLSIVGYMIALDYEGEHVTRFMLVRDLASCCMGGIPRPDEWVEVELSTPCPYWLYRPVRATGRFKVGIQWDEQGGLLASAFQLTSATAALER